MSFFKINWTENSVVEIELDESEIGQMISSGEFQKNEFGLTNNNDPMNCDIYFSKEYAEEVVSIMENFLKKWKTG